MRIVAGAAKGRRLAVPPQGVRPTPDRVREALFSSLADSILDAHVLDLFAGSGALGLEALSRGARHVTFVEQNPKTAAILSRNIDTVALAGATKHTQSAARFLASTTTLRFDVVFLDAPYDVPTSDIEQYLTALDDHLAAGATVVVERDRRQAAPRFPEGFGEVTMKRYGNVVLYRACRVVDGSVNP